MRRPVLPPTYLYAAIGLMVALHFLLPLATLCPVPWNFLGFIPLLAGVALNIAADRAFKRAQTTVKPYEESQTLVTDGVFARSRNPMYLGMVLALSGIGMLLGTLSPFLVIIPFAAAMHAVFIRAEERMLAATFGDAWTAYTRQVRRWL
jgi:protein-S-isoprenylcysteine O-methyltransferase Ste14